MDNSIIDGNDSHWTGSEFSPMPAPGYVTTNPGMLPEMGPNNFIEVGQSYALLRGKQINIGPYPFQSEDFNSMPASCGVAKETPCPAGSTFVNKEVGCISAGAALNIVGRGDLQNPSSFTLRKLLSTVH